jgi:tRNA-splicing ligase RtcB
VHDHEPFEREPYVWEVPVGTVAGMRVPGVVFANRELLGRARDDRAVEQVANVATLPGVVGASYAMPDIHWGYGFPIGGVAATDVDAGGVVSPGGVGFDIGCGVRLVRSDLAWEPDVRGRIRPLMRELGQRIPAGTGGDGLLPLSGDQIDQVLRDGVGYPLSRGLGWDEDAERCEDGGRVPGARTAEVSGRARERGGRQLGSLGGGNHFLEVQVVEEIRHERAARAMGLFAGQVCVMIHTGSRGLGHQVCTDHLRVLDRLMPALGVQVPDRQLACLPVEHERARAYLGAMAAAANFALANRHVLTDGLRQAFAAVLGRDARALGLHLVYDVSHNQAKLEDHDVGGRRRTLCVHRKGATRALGPGSLSDSFGGLPAAYREVGQPVLVPGSMGTASYALVGDARAATRSFASTCHGAGRTLSRTRARKTVKGQELLRQLEADGIIVRTKTPRLLGEEAPDAYKDAAAVVDTCEGAGLSKVVAKLRPVGVVKG